MRAVVLGVCVWLVTAAAAWAQFDTATVLGTVRDSSEAVVPGAKVTLTAVETGISAVKVSGVDGNYEFAAVRPGSLRGDQRKERILGGAGGRRAGPGRRPPARRPAHVGRPASEKVEVSSSQPLVETDSSQRGQVISGEQIRALPLVSREYSSLALLTTGVKLAGSSLTTGNTPREGAFNVNGLRSTVNNFLIDGIDNNAYGTSNQGFSNQVMQPPPDAITEFKVVTNNMSAEYGRAAGATINVNYRSGTNTIHGTAWEFLRDTSMNATGYFKPPTGKPTLDRHQFGGVFGGPLVRNKAFVFGDYEGLRQTRRVDGFRHHRHADAAPGHPDRRRSRPAERGHLPGGHGDPDDGLRPQGARGAARQQRGAAPPTTTPRSRSSPPTRTRAASRWTSSSRRPRPCSPATACAT